MVPVHSIRSRSSLHLAAVVAASALTALAACGSDGPGRSSSTDTIAEPATDDPTTSSAPTSAAAPTTGAPTTAQLVPSTEAPPSTVGEAADVEPSGGEPTLVTAEGVPLATGQHYRAEIYGTSFEFVGEDGWLAFATGNSAYAFRLGAEPWSAFAGFVRLVDARPSAGVGGADLTGIAVPLDPFAAVTDVQAADGSPILDMVADLPADWHEYLDGLPGIEFATRGSGELGRFAGELGTFAVAGLPASPGAMCATPGAERCITIAVETGSSYFYTEGDEVASLVTEVGGQRFEYVSGTNGRTLTDPAVAEELDRIVASFRAVG